MNRHAFLLSSILALTSTAASCVEIPLWQPRDFEFRSETRHENPFTLDFQAHVTSPDGEGMIIPGFYDGDGVWKIRFSPTTEGAWSLKTASPDPELDGKTIDDITAVSQPNPNIRGGLRIDPEHPRHFIREDGSRFFLMGYECDWLWALDTTRPDLPVLSAFLDKLTDHGFNYIIMNLYAHDTPWRKGQTEIRDYGPPPIYPWEGTNDDPVFDRLNPEFWQHYDRVIEAMHQGGIVAHIMTKVFNKMVNWPANNSPEDDLFYRTLIARYSAYPNVVWDFAKEAHGEGSVEYKIARMQSIRELDPYNRLMTIHDDTANYDSGVYNDLLDYRSDQQHSEWYPTVISQREQNEWPVINVEFGYEWGPKGEGDATFPVNQSPLWVYWRGWEVYMAGGYGAYYYTYTAWDIIHTEHTPPGYGYFKNLRDFFEGIRYWLLEPDDSVISRGHCLMIPGEEYAIFQGQPGEFTLTIEGAKSRLSSEWFNPLTGERIRGRKLGNGTHTLTSPPGWDEYVALHVRIGGK